MHPATSLSELLGLAAIAFVLGLRHGADADHLAAIDALTRCNADARPALARRTGLWFAAGHGAVVLLVAFAVALGVHMGTAPAWLAPFGAWASIAMLALLGALNLFAWRRAAPGATVALAGWRSRLFEVALRAGSRGGVAGVGALFAISFDTVGQAALMAASGTASAGLGAVGLLAGAFVAGMAVTDGLNGWWAARLMQATAAGAAQASRVMCIAVSVISLGTAALGATIELSPPVAEWAGAHAGAVALAIVGVLVASALAGLALARRKDALAAA